MAVNPNISELDQQQILQRSFDGDNDRLRVDAELSASIIAPPGLEVSIQAPDDNIAIRNSNNSNELLIAGDGSITINNITGTISLPTGASTSVLQTTGNLSLASIETNIDVALSTRASELTLSTLNNKFNSLGQKTMTNSVPVVLASDQSAIPVSQSGTWNINDISGTISLPTGASTSANQTTANNSLSSIDTKSTRAWATATNTRPTVTTTSSTILASNSNRKSAIIFNQSGAVIYLKYTNAAVVGEGIRLANNEKHEIGFDNLFTGAITAIRLAGSGAVDVMEGTT